MVMPTNSVSDEIVEMRKEMHKAFLQSKERMIPQEIENILGILETLKSIKFPLFYDDQAFKQGLDQDDISQALCEILAMYTLSAKKYSASIELLNNQLGNNTQILSYSMRNFHLLILDSSDLIKVFLNISDDYFIRFQKYAKLCSELNKFKKFCEFLQNYIRETLNCFFSSNNHIAAEIPQIESHRSLTDGATHSLSENKKDTFSLIPDEVLSQICSYLPEIFFMLRAVDRRFRANISTLVRLPYFQKILFEKFFPHRIEAVMVESVEINWLEELKHATEHEYENFSKNEYVKLPPEIQKLFFAAKTGDKSAFLKVPLCYLYETNRYKHSPLIWLGITGHQTILDWIFNLAKNADTQLKQLNPNNVLPSFLRSDYNLAQWAIACQQPSEHLDLYDKPEDIDFLLHAIKYNHQGAVTYFLNKGHQVQRPHYQAAAFNGNLNIIYQLASYDIPPQSTPAISETDQEVALLKEPSFYAIDAAKAGHLQTTLTLLKMETNPQELKWNLYQSACEAAAAGQTHVVLALLSHKQFDPIISHPTPLNEAVRERQFRTVVKILSFDPETINRSDNLDFTPLHRAVLGANIEMISFLLSKGADIHASTGTRTGTPLELAVKRNKNQVVKKLLDCVGDKLDLGVARTALMHAVDEGNADNVKTLLSFKSDLISNTNSEDLLRSAVKRGLAAILKILLAHKVQVNNLNWSVFYVAINSRKFYRSDESKIEVIKVLVEANADINLKTNCCINFQTNGYTPLEVAAHSGRTAICYALLQPNTKISYLVLKEFIMRENLEGVKKILAYNNEWMNKDEYRAAIYAAWDVSNSEILCELLSINKQIPNLQGGEDDIDCINELNKLIQASTFPPLQKELFIYLITEKAESKLEMNVTIFGHTFTLFPSDRVSKRVKVIAAEALREVVFHRKDEASLQPHSEAFTTSKLSSLYKMYLQEKSEQNHVSLPTQLRL